MKLNPQGSKLLQGAFILSAAAIVSKLIGTLQKIPLQNLGGDAVFGIYNTVYPLYTMLVTVAMLGLPPAISKFVAEASAGGDEAEGRRVLRLSAILTAISGLVIGVLTYAGAPVIAGWVGNSHIIPALHTSAWGLAVVPLMAAMRGYFQGLHNMVPTAVSQVVEQSVRVIVMIALLLYLTRNGADAANIAAGALLGSAGAAPQGCLSCCCSGGATAIRSLPYCRTLHPNYPPPLPRLRQVDSPASARRLGAGGTKAPKPGSCSPTGCRSCWGH